MTSRLIILAIILVIMVVVTLLSRDFLSPRIRRLVPTNTAFSRVTLLLVLVIGINMAQSLWIYTEKTARLFPIPGDAYKILPRDFTDLNSMSERIPTLYSIQNLYIALDELTTSPRIYSLNSLIPPDSENQSKLYGTVWPDGDITVVTHINQTPIQSLLESLEPTQTGTIYNTLKKIDDGIDWKIYTARNDASADEIIVFSDRLDGRSVWTFVDTRLLDTSTVQELRR